MNAENVGRGIIIGGKIWRGISGTAAELGHMTIDWQEIYRLNHNIVERLRRNRERLRYVPGNDE